MRNIIYYVTMSLDGFIAGPNDEVDWIIIDPAFDFTSMINRFDTIIVGRKTFEATKSMSDGVSFPGITTYLVSKTLQKEENPRFNIIGKDLFTDIKQIKEGSGKDIWLFGGGELFRSLLELDLVEAIQVAVIPVLLGKGIRFLPETSNYTTLKLTQSSEFKNTGTIVLEYLLH